MKRKLRLYLYCFIATSCVFSFLCACSSSIKNDAEKQMKKIMCAVSDDPNPQISDIKTIFETDSTIILHCTYRGLNKFGGYNRVEVEYIYVLLHDGKRMEAFKDLEKEKSVVESGVGFNDYLNELPQCTNPSEDSTSWVENVAKFYCLYKGHIIQD